MLASVGASRVLRAGALIRPFRYQWASTSSALAGDAAAEASPELEEHENQGSELQKPASRFEQYAGEVAVLKFGGSSLGSANAMRSVARIIVDQQAKYGAVAAVLSAMYGVTDKLVHAAESAVTKDVEAVEAVLDDLRKLHNDTVDMLFSKNFVLDSGVRTSKPLIDKVVVRDLLDMQLDCDYVQPLEHAMETGTLSPAERDRVHSLGERLSAIIMSQYLLSCGRRARAIPPSHLIVTEGEHGGGLPELSETSVRLRRELTPLFRSDTLAIIPGFYGGSRSSGDITTFGRGGSDLTATVVGHAVNARVVTLWKVEHEKLPQSWRMGTWKDGFVGIVHSADTSSTIDEVTYGDAATMSHFGKQVLHPETVFPVEEKGIPLRVANTLKPDEPGTLIGRSIDSSKKKYGATTTVSVSLKKYMSLRPGARINWRGSRKYVPVGEKVNLDPATVPADSALVVQVGVDTSDMPEEMAEYLLTAPLRTAGIPYVVPSKVDNSLRDAFVIAVPRSREAEACAALHHAFVDGSSGSMRTQFIAQEAEGKPYVLESTVDIDVEESLKGKHSDTEMS